MYLKFAERVNGLMNSEEDALYNSIYINDQSRSDLKEGKIKEEVVIENNDREVLE